ncbi:MAG: hypothetical protein HYT37_02615 [Candidatus Sungbacteria bacterium]|nr:hypothetical protein [Candidatus Sungbacteria bacterium]
MAQIIDYQDFFADEKSRRMIDAVLAHPNESLERLIELAGIVEDDLQDILPLLDEDTRAQFTLAFKKAQKPSSALP